MIDKHYKWIRILEIGRSKSGKTLIFSVINKMYKEQLGEIRWRPSYRKYAFYPIEETYYERDCLKNISDFLKELEERRAKPWR